MSKINKRKHVLNEAMKDDYDLPKGNQSIVKVLKAMGNHLHEITTPSGDHYLVSMPTKFRNNIWVKRGSYIVVEPIIEGQKVKAEVVKILTKDCIKYYKENNAWPKEFEDVQKEEMKKDNDDLFVNTNRVNVMSYDVSDSDSSSDSDCDDDKQ